MWLPQALLSYRSTVHNSTGFSPDVWNTQKACNRYKDYYDAKAKEATYKVGDKVWLHVPVVKKGKNLKLSRPWQGPNTVVKRLSDVVYRIELVSTGCIKKTEQT